LTGRKKIAKFRSNLVEKKTGFIDDLDKEEEEKNYELSLASIDNSSEDCSLNGQKRDIPVFKEPLSLKNRKDNLLFKNLSSRLG
jgi:hypothetical protein